MRQLEYRLRSRTEMWGIRLAPSRVSLPLAPMSPTRREPTATHSCSPPLPAFVLCQHLVGNATSSASRLKDMRCERDKRRPPCYDDDATSLAPSHRRYRNYCFWGKLPSSRTSRLV